MAKAQTKEAVDRVIAKLKDDLAGVETTSSVDDLLAAARKKLIGGDAVEAQKLGLARQDAIIASRAPPAPEALKEKATEEPPEPSEPAATEEPVEDDCPKLVEVQLQYMQKLVVPTLEQRKAGVLVSDDLDAIGCYNEHFGIRNTVHKHTCVVVDRLRDADAMMAAGYVRIPAAAEA